MVAVPVSFTVTLPSGRKATVAAVARLVPAVAWETRSCGPGCKGHRDYAWAWAATASPRHWVLIRRSLSDPDDLAFFDRHVPAGRPVTLAILVKVAGKRWPVEVTFKTGKDTLGWDTSQARTYDAICRHTALTALAQIRTAAIRAALSGAVFPAVAGQDAPAAAGQATVRAADLQIYTGSAPLPAHAGQPCPPASPRSGCPPPRPPASTASPATGKPGSSASPASPSISAGHAGGDATRHAPAGTTTAPAWQPSPPEPRRPKEGDTE